MVLALAGREGTFGWKIKSCYKQTFHAFGTLLILDKFKLFNNLNLQKGKF